MWSRNGARRECAAMKPRAIDQDLTRSVAKMFRPAVLSPNFHRMALLNELTGSFSFHLSVNRAY